MLCPQCLLNPFLFSGMVHYLRAQQTDKLHCVRFDHGQRVHVPCLQREPVRLERWAVPGQKHSKNRQNRFANMSSAFRVYAAHALHISFLLFCCVLHTTFTGLVLKENQYKEKDMSCVPKFTQPLVDRSVVAGYSTAISCAVKGFPRVSMCTYLKDSMEKNSAARDVSCCMCNKG